MGFKNFFRKKEEHTPDPVSELILANLKQGYFVDYDLKTWEVVSANRYDWGSDDFTYEWQLETHDETIFLEREPDDEDYWTISRKLPFKKLDLQAQERLTQSETAPETILFEGTKYYLDETGGALFYKNNSATGKEVFKWDYCDETEKKSLTVEQWGENEYELSKGMKVEEYQFSNILPNI